MADGLDSVSVFGFRSVGERDLFIQIRFSQAVGTTQVSIVVHLAHHIAVGGAFSHIHGGITRPIRFFHLTYVGVTDQPDLEFLPPIQNGYKVI